MGTGQFVFLHFVQVLFNFGVDYVLKLDHGSHLIRDALKSPNHKKNHFNFFLGCI